MKRSERETDMGMQIPPPEKRIKEPEEAPRWLHALAGLVVGGVVGLAVSKGLWRMLGIPRAATMLAAMLTMAVAGSVWRGRLWRWMNL
jgi:hypothetical protein